MPHDHDHDPAEESHQPAPRRRAVFILVCIFITLVLLGLQVLWTSRVKVSAVTKPAGVRLTGRSLHPTRIRIHVTGWIDGQATMTVPRQDPVTIGPGNIEWKYSGTWAEPECLLQYTPLTVTMGSLEVDYTLD